MTEAIESYDVVVIGGGPSGATAATDLARKGHKVMLLDKAGRIKPCGGAIPPRLIQDFEIPDELLKAKARSARIISPTDRYVDMPIENGFVGMVDRDEFDEWLRKRAEAAGAHRRTGTFDTIERDSNGRALVSYMPKPKDGEKPARVRVLAKSVIGADGARSKVAKLTLPKGKNEVPCVFAYHEIIKSPPEGTGTFDGSRCDVFYQGPLSPDFYAWIFPHGETTSIGVGSAQKGFSLRGSVRRLRGTAQLDIAETVRSEGAPIPMKPLKRWDNGQDVLLCGDAAGVVAPSSGEGIYYAMACARFAADAVDQFLVTGNAKALRAARKRFMKDHGRVFFILGMMQHFWYKNDKRRERFVTMCDDPDVQRLTWQSYMHKRLEYTSPKEHIRIFFKDLGHLFGVVAER